MGLDFCLSTKFHICFQNCHIWAWNLAIGQRSRSCTYSLFLSQEAKLIMGRGFRDMGRFSKLPYLGMKPGHWPKFQKLHKYTLFLPLPNPVGVKLSLFTRYGHRRFPRYGPIFNCHISAWNLGNVQSSRNCTYCNIWAWNLGIGQSSRNCTYYT